MPSREIVHSGGNYEIVRDLKETPDRLDPEEQEKEDFEFGEKVLKNYEVTKKKRIIEWIFDIVIIMAIIIAVVSAIIAIKSKVG